MADQTARERFVEAMRYLSVEYRNHHAAWVRQAVEAFSDAECTVRLTLMIHPATATKPHREHTDEQHRVCRASLLRDCGLADE